MKIQRKLAGFSACALVLSSLTVPVAHAAEVDFNDIDSHWAKSSIERWAGYEVVNGMGNNQFKPEDTMTRAQMAQILSKTLGLTATTTTNPFSDVSDSDWFKDAILKCNAAGIMNGTSATTAKPNDPISRQDAVTMMSRALGIEADGDSTSFDDNGSIGSWAVGFVNAMAKRGIVNGRSEGMFAPTGDIKRGEIVTILDRAITTYVNTPDTEVTATGKGITLIAASGVTVKGEAEDVLVAPAAAGTTKLDGVKVSGAVTMQAANGTLVLGGATTAAKLNIPALATGAKITIEKDATVAAVSSSADNVAIDGNGTITAMTVETGKGVTVAGSVKVGKITNNSQDSMKHGNNVIAGVGGTKPSTGGGGGGSSSGGSGGGSQGNTDPVAGTPTNQDSWDNFITAAQKTDGDNPNVVANFDTTRESATIINDKVERLDLDLNNAKADTLTIRAANAEIINITGDADDQIGTLIIDAPKATVTSEITVDEANIEAVKDESYHPKKPHQKILLKGKGKLDVPSEAGKPEVVVLSKNADDKITISGDVTNVTVKSPAEIILDAISQALTLTSQNKNANITVNANNSNNVTLTGDIKTLKADGNVELKGATVADATVAENATITGDSATTITTVTAAEEATTVSLSGAMTVSAVKTTETTTTVNLDGTTVTSVTTSTSLEIKGSGSVASVDVVNATTKVTITNSGTVTVTTVTAVGDTKVEDIDASGANATNKNIQKKAPAPTGLAGKRSDTWGDSGKITGAKAGQEYKVANDEMAEWTSITADGDITVDAPSTTGGSYLVRTAKSNAYTLDSEPVTVVVPAQVGVQSAEIFGSAVAGQELKAVANSTVAEAADDQDMAYQWKNNGENIPGATSATYKAENGQVLTVVISNYKGEGGSVESDPVYTEEKEGSIDNIKAALKQLIDAAKANIKDFKTSEDGFDVLATEQYVEEAAKTKYQAAIDEADTQYNNATTAKQISDAMKALKAATATFNDAKKYGTLNPTTASTLKVEFAANSAIGTVTVAQDSKPVTGENGTYTVSKDADATINVAFDAAMNQVTYKIGSDTAQTATLTNENKATSFTVAKDNLANDVTVTINATAKPGEGGGDEPENPSEDEYTVSWTVEGAEAGDDVTGAEVTVKDGETPVTSGTTKFTAEKTLTVTVGTGYTLVEPTGGTVTVNKTTPSFVVKVKKDETSAETVDMTLTIDTTSVQPATSGIAVKSGTTTISANPENVYAMPVGAAGTIDLTFDEAVKVEATVATTATTAAEGEGNADDTLVVTMSDGFKKASIAVPDTKLVKDAPITVTIKATALGISVTGAPLVDHSSGSDVTLDVTMKAELAVPEATDTGADYVIKLSTEGDKPIPQHMNADNPASMGWWAGFGIHKSDKNTATDYTTNASIWVSSTEFKPTTEPKDTSFDSTLPVDGSSPLYGTLYANLKGANFSDAGKMYLTIQWNANNVEHVILDASALKNSADTNHFLKDKMNTLLSTMSNGLEVESVTYTADTEGSTVPTYAITLKGTDIESGVPNNPTDLATLFDSTQLTHGTGTDNNDTNYTVATLPFVDIISAQPSTALTSDSNITIQQTNTALGLYNDSKAFPNNVKTKVYTVDQINGSDGTYSFLVQKGATGSKITIKVFNGGSDGSPDTTDTNLLATYEIDATGIEFATTTP